MKKNKIDKTKRVPKQTPDLRREVLDKFKKLYPPLFNNEGMLNQEELEQLVNNFSTPQIEKYEFNWAGKQQAMMQFAAPVCGRKLFCCRVMCDAEHGFRRIGDTRQAVILFRDQTFAHLFGASPVPAITLVPSDIRSSRRAITMAAMSLATSSGDRSALTTPQRSFSDPAIAR